MHCLLQPEPEITQAAITAVFADRNAEMEIRHPPQAFNVFEQPCGSPQIQVSCRRGVLKH